MINLIEETMEFTCVINSKPIRRLASTMAVLFTLLGSNAAYAETWLTHNDPKGFVVSYPVAWKILITADKAVIVRSPDFSLFSIIRPFKSSETASNWLTNEGVMTTPLFQDVAVTRLRKTNSEPDTAAAQISYTSSGGTSGQASFLDAVSNSNGIFYAIAAPKAEFVARRSELLHIVESFRFTSPHGAVRRRFSPTTLRFVNWTDPRENAFRLQVPAGWKISGGLFRSGPIDIRPAVMATSPDGAIHSSIGTQGIIIFAEPTQMTYDIGYHNGSIYSPGHGQEEMIMPYMTGAEFSKFYIEQTLGRSVPDLNFRTVRDLPDVTRVAARAAQASDVGAIHNSASAGEALFTGTLKNRPYIGFCEAIIIRTQTAGIPGGQWVLRGLMVFTAPREEGLVGSAAVQRMQSTFVFNPDFMERESMNAAQVGRDLESSAQATDRSFQDADNIINGEVTVVDPTTGEQSQTASGSNYYWNNGSGSTIGTNSYQSPGVSFSELKQLW